MLLCFPFVCGAVILIGLCKSTHFLNSIVKFNTDNNIVQKICYDFHVLASEVLFSTEKVEHVGCGMMGGGSYLRNKGQISLDITARLTKRSHPFSFLSVCLPGKSEKNVQAQISYPVCLVTHVLVYTQAIFSEPRATKQQATVWMADNIKVLGFSMDSQQKIYRIVPVDFIIHSVGRPSCLFKQNWKDRFFIKIASIGANLHGFWVKEPRKPAH